MKPRNLKFTEAINEAMILSMKRQKNIICYGLGVDDPKRIFGTTKNLKEIFGSKRVFDVPASENALTGIGVGSSLNGLRPVMVHQRLDFFLYAMDQLINGAAKWSYIFGGNKSLPITIRLIIGRGWGQGPTHSQSLQSLFAHIPGLKIVMPSNAYQAKGLLNAAIFDNNPVLYLEHRWLHNTFSNVPKKFYKLDISQPQILKKGKDLTIVSMGYMTNESIIADKILRSYGIQSEIIDMCVMSPLNLNRIFNSVKKTKHLLVLDTSTSICSLSSEILSQVFRKCFKYLKSKPEILALPHVPQPTSFGLTKNFYNDYVDIIKSVKEILKIKKDIKIKDRKKILHDVPDADFKGPF
jgi:acetoin:2,6-dichlorophenolindophenol oxidoreductase subunit beta